MIERTRVDCWTVLLPDGQLALSSRWKGHPALFRIRKDADEWRIRKQPKGSRTIRAQAAVLTE